MDDHLVRVADLGAYSSSESESHSAESARCDQLSRVIEVEMLYSPHLMLSDVSRYDRILRNQSCDRVADLLRCESVAALFIYSLCRIREYEFLPFRMLLLSQSLVQHLQNFLGITDNVVIRHDVLVDLGSVDIYVYDFRLLCKGRRIKSNTVREPASDSYEKVAVVACYVRCL